MLEKRYIYQFAPIKVRQLTKGIYSQALCSGILICLIVQPHANLSDYFISVFNKNYGLINVIPNKFRLKDEELLPENLSDVA